MLFLSAALLDRELIGRKLGRRSRTRRPRAIFPYDTGLSTNLHRLRKEMIGNRLLGTSQDGPVVSYNSASSAAPPYQSRPSASSKSRGVDAGLPVPRSAEQTAEPIQHEDGGVRLAGGTSDELDTMNDIPPVYRRYSN